MCLPICSTYPHLIPSVFYADGTFLCVHRLLSACICVSPNGIFITGNSWTISGQVASPRYLLGCNLEGSRSSSSKATQGLINIKLTEAQSLPAHTAGGRRTDTHVQTLCRHTCSKGFRKASSGCETHMPSVCFIIRCDSPLPSGRLLSCRCPLLCS